MNHCVDDDDDEFIGGRKDGGRGRGRHLGHDGLCNGVPGRSISAFTVT